MDTRMIQEIVNEAVKVATRAAMNKTPVQQVVWVPPRTAMEDYRGSFVVVPCGPLDAGTTPPWEG